MRFPPVAQACKALRWPSKRRGPNRYSLMDAFTPPPACSSSPFFLLLLLATSTEVRQYLTCTKSVRPVFCLAFFSPVPLSKPLVHCQRMCSLSFNWPPKKQAAARYVGQPRHVCQLMSVQQKAEEALWSEAAIVTWYYSRIPRDGPMFFIAVAAWVPLQPWSFGGHSQNWARWIRVTLQGLWSHRVHDLVFPKKAAVQVRTEFVWPKGLAKMIGVVSPKRHNRCRKDDPTVPLRLQRIAGDSRPPRQGANARHSEVMASLSGSENREKPAVAEFVGDHMAACQSPFSRCSPRGVCKYRV